MINCDTSVLQQRSFPCEQADSDLQGTLCKNTRENMCNKWKVVHTKVTKLAIIIIMGWELFIKNLLEDSGKRSWLWRHEKVYDVLKYNKVNGRCSQIELCCKICCTLFCPCYFSIHHASYPVSQHWSRSWLVGARKILNLKFINQICDNESHAQSNCHRSWRLNKW